MSLKVAHVWDDFVCNSFIEVQPLLAKHQFDVNSITITRTLRDNGSGFSDKVFFHRRLSHALWHNPSFFAKIRGYLDRRLFRFSFLQFSKRVLQSENIELVHFHFGFTAAQYPEIAEDRPFLVAFYGSDISAALQSAYWRYRYRKILPKAALLLVLCEEAKQRLVRLGCDPGKIRVWNLPAGVEKYPLRAAPESSDCPKIITTARFVEKKGHGMLLEAFSILLAKGVSFSATLLGYGEGIDWVRREISRRGLEKVTVIDTKAKGDFPNLHYSLLLEHDIFVLPSITAKSGDDEGGPALTMVCAQAAGLPVVCTKFPGSEITMREGITGHYIPENHAQALASSIEKIFSSRDKWRSMGEEGSKLAQLNFGEREQVAKLVKFYEEISANARGGVLPLMQ